MLGTFFKPEFINVNLESTDKDELFEEMVEQFVRGGATLNRAAVLDALFERESKQTTGVLPNVAIPHATCEELPNDFCAVGISRAGIEYGSLDQKPVHIVFMLLFGADGVATHLKALQEIAVIVKESDFVQKVMELSTAQEVFDLLCKYEEALA